MKKITIPNLCLNTRLLMSMSVTQLLVVVAWLLIDGTAAWTTFGFWSVYSQAFSLGCSFALCGLRHSISKMPYLFGALTTIFLIVLVAVSIDLSAQNFGGAAYKGLDFSRLSRVAAASLIIALLAIRLFTLVGTWQKRNRAEVEVRMQSLQSRIQPHFLFNSLNTISELTATEPDKAEKAISALAMLFRASLENNRKTHSLEHELNLCRRFVELERWRVGDRLNIDWAIHVESEDQWSVPKLILQPLVENAIFHGVQIDGSIHVHIDVRETIKYISVMVENIKGQEPTMIGHGIAVDNIKERLFVAYDDQQAFKIKESETHYTVIMRFPKIAKGVVADEH